MLTTNELFKRVISQTYWYEPLGFTKQYAYKLKTKFLSGKLTDIKQQEILLLLGYEIENPTTWKEKKT